MKKHEIKICSCCGGKMKRKNSNTYKCVSCGLNYYVSVDRTHRFSVYIPSGMLVILVVVLFMSVIAAAVYGYTSYTEQLKANHNRFSKSINDFLTEVYQKRLLTITDEDLEKIKYLKVEKDGGSLIFTYSFEDIYQYGALGDYQDTMKRFEVENYGYAPTDIQFFAGLTRLEIYEDAWENHELSKDNVIRSISCIDGYSYSGSSRFFANVNPETLEEVEIFSAEHMKDFSFIKEISKIKKFTLENVVLTEADMFMDFENLEYLELKNPDISQENIYGIMEQLLSIQSLKVLKIDGHSAWYLSEEEWQKLQEKYGTRVTLERT